MAVHDAPLMETPTGAAPSSGAKTVVKQFSRAFVEFTGYTAGTYQLWGRASADSPGLQIGADIVANGVVPLNNPYEAVWLKRTVDGGTVVAHAAGQYVRD